MRTKKNKIFWVIKEIFGAIVLLCFLSLIGLYLIFMLPEWFWGEPLIESAGVWECPEITIMAFGEPAYLAQGEVRLYGKKYFVEVAPENASSRYYYRVYDVELRETEIGGGNKETCIWEFSVKKMKKKTFSFTVEKDYLSVREGKAKNEKSSEYVGKKLVLKKQERELPTFYFQEKGTWKCDELTIVSDGVTEDYPYAETSGTLRFNDKEIPSKIYNSAYEAYVKDLTSVRYKPEGGEWYARSFSWIIYPQEDKLCVKILERRWKEKEEDEWKAEKLNLLYVLEKQPDGEFSEGFIR